MDNPENLPAPSSEPSELQEQYDALQHFVVSVLLLVLIMAGTVWVYLFMQVKWTKREVEGLRNVVGNYQKTTGAATDSFIKKLEEFGKKNADFSPILLKYGITDAAPASATSPGTQKKK